MMYVTKFCASFFQILGLVILGMSLSNGAFTVMADADPITEVDCNQGCEDTVGVCKDKRGLCDRTSHGCENVTCNGPADNCDCS